LNKPASAITYFLIFETLKMKQFIQRMLLVQGIVLTSTGVFAGGPVGKKEIPSNPSVTANVPGKENSWLAEHLVSFNAEYDRRAVDLHWNLAGAKIGGHFNVERSLDGEHFEKIGEVNASNPSFSRYGFTDEIKPSVARKNDLYYRLQQVDGEHSSYSKVLIVRMFETHSVASISVTPDPTVNDIQVNVQLKASSFVVMKVTDAGGNEVMKKTAKADEGTNSYSLEGTNKLKPGNYKLEIIVNSNERMLMQLSKG
jgi:hypothetical protein